MNIHLPFRYVPFGSVGDVLNCCVERCSQCQNVLPGIKTSKMATGMLTMSNDIPAK